MISGGSHEHAHTRQYVPLVWMMRMKECMEMGNVSWDMVRTWQLVCNA
jgi:hypothetical protein